LRLVLAELCALLLEQKSVLETILGLSQEERRVIISGESEKLEDIVRRELRELSKLGGLEKKRAALHKTISAELGLGDQEVTVSAIAKQAMPDERAAITSLQKELISLISRHTALNMENRELIKTHLEYSETMLDIMVDAEDPLNNFYGGDGRAAPDKKKMTGFFDGHA